MDNRKQILLVIVLMAPILAALVYFLYSANPAINWEEHYRSESKDPYGAYVVKELMKEYNGSFKEIKTEPLDKVQLPKGNTKANYVFIGENLFLGPKSLDTLLTFVERGNIAFISSKNFPKELIDTLFPEHCNEWNGHYHHFDSVVTFNFNHQDLEKGKGYLYKSPNKGKDTTRMFDWSGIDGNYFCDSLTYTVNAGFIIDRAGNKYVNFIEYNYGKGKFIFHTTPVVFTNYYLKSSSGSEYAEKVLSHLNKGSIYWDEYGKVSYIDEEEARRASPIKLILENDHLRFAWYLGILLIILYIIFYAKRKQRAIAIKDEKVNTSLEYIKTIGTLYFQQNNHRHLMRLKLRLFLNFIRQRYSIPTNKINDELTKKIALKSNVPISDIDSILKEINVVNRYDIQMELDDLVRLHNSLDHFYKICK